MTVINYEQFSEAISGLIMVTTVLRTVRDGLAGIAGELGVVL